MSRGCGETAIGAAVKAGAGFQGFSLRDGESVAITVQSRLYMGDRWLESQRMVTRRVARLQVRRSRAFTWLVRQVRLRDYYHSFRFVIGPFLPSLSWQLCKAKFFRSLWKLHYSSPCITLAC